MRFFGFGTKAEDPPREDTAADDDGAAEEMRALEAGTDVPRDPRDWPAGRAKYLTFGASGDEAYGDGATGMLGPAGVTHNDDGTISVAGKVVDNPEHYRGKPITGGIIEQLDKKAGNNRRRREAEARVRDEPPAPE
jgi:hypothetical protein